MVYISSRELEEYKDYWKKNYDGFDMSASDKSEFTEFRKKNYAYLRKARPEIAAELPFEKFKLQCWKGHMWWGEPIGPKWHPLEEFGGWDTNSIINWIVEHPEYWQDSSLEPERKISAGQRHFVCNRQNWKCNICHVKLKYSAKNEWEAEVAHIDHIHPYSKRYSYIHGAANINELENLQALCPTCNFKKRDKNIN
jgi:hypothetical protein